MKIKTRLDIIQFSDGVEFVINDALKLLAKLPVSDLVDFLTGPQLFARRDHATVLKNVMRDEVWKFKLVSRVADKGLSHDFYGRLDYFDDSPLTVLENLFVKMVKIQPEMLDEYLEDMWLFAIQVVNGKEKVLSTLLGKARTSAVSNIVLIDLFPAINVLFADGEGEIDGVAKATFSEKAMHAATLKEIREIAEANNVFVPTNITKQDIVDSLLKVIPTRFKAKDVKAVSQDVQEMTVIELKAFVEEHKLDVPTELRKVDVADLLAKGYVAANASRVLSVSYVLPERVDVKIDIGDENPKVARLSKRVEELQKELESAKLEAQKEPVKIVEKEVVEVVDEKAIRHEQERRAELEQELKATQEKLDAKPKEVIVEVPGPTIVRTVVSKKELVRQKEKYEQIIADQEKERALLVSRVDEMAQYSKPAVEEIEKVVKPEVREVVREESGPVARGANDELHAKVDRLMDKIHEMQLDMLKRELDIVSRQKSGEADRETEVNLFFDSNLARKMVASKDGGEQVVRSEDRIRKSKRSKKKSKHPVLKTLLWLIIITLVVFFGGWLINYYIPGLFALPAWISWVNDVIRFLYSVTESVFVWFRWVWSLVVGIFSN